MENNDEYKILDNKIDNNDDDGDILENCFKYNQIIVSNNKQLIHLEQESAESSSNNNDEKDPFSLKCRIPLPNINGNYSYFDTSTFIKRRNERERTRVRNVNDGFERLRNHLPLLQNQQDKRLSKVETLRLAISYIKHLQNILES